MGMEQQEEQSTEDLTPDEGDSELEAQRVAAFSAAFDGKPTEPPPATDEERAQEEQPDATAAEQAEPPAPKTRTLTEDEYAELTALRAKVPDLEQAMKRDRDAIYGTIGGLQRSINQRQGITLPKDKLDALRLDMPDVVDLFEAAAAQANAAPAFDPEALVKSAEERLKPQLDAARQEALTLARHELRAELLSQQHADWRDVTGSAEFQAHAKAKGEQFLGQLSTASNEWDYRFIGAAIADFKAAKKRAADSATTRRDRMAANVTPRGSSAPANPAKTREEIFMEGWNSSP